MKTLVTIAAAALATTALVSGASAQARDNIQIVGSSTVFPFTTAVAERFGQMGNPTPVVESTGTGGGMKLFCSGVGADTPDFTNASRPIKEGELAECADNGVTPVEIKVGFDGIVMGSSKQSEPVDYTKEQIFAALAKQVVVDDEVVDNPYTSWSDIDPSLPNKAIEVLGPPPTSGTRDAFIELVMEEACPEAIEANDACGELREDGAFVEAGENDNLIVQKLEANADAYGIFGFSFLDQNTDVLQGASIGGVEPTFENIASGDYGVSRSLFVYAKAEHADVIPGFKEFLAEFTSEGAFGEDGYLADKGLIPLPEEDRLTVQDNAANLTPVSM